MTAAVNSYRCRKLADWNTFTSDKQEMTQGEITVRHIQVPLWAATVYKRCLWQSMLSLPSFGQISTECRRVWCIISSQCLLICAGHFARLCWWIWPVWEAAKTFWGDMQVLWLRMQISQHVLTPWSTTSREYWNWMCAAQTRWTTDMGSVNRFWTPMSPRASVAKSSELDCVNW